MGTVEIVAAVAGILGTSISVIGVGRKWSREGRAEIVDRIDALQEQNHTEHMHTAGKIDEVSKSVHKLDTRLARHEARHETEDRLAG